MFLLRLTFAQSVVTSEQTDKADKMGQVWGYVYSNLMEQICVHTLSNDMHVYDIYGTKYKYFHSLNQWYIYDIYGTIFPWNNDMYISMEQICPYLKQWYVPVYGIYGTNMFVLGTIIWGCLYLKQVYSYRNRTSLVCTLSGTDKTSLHQCQLIM